MYAFDSTDPTYPAVRAFIDDQFGPGTPFNANISSADEMFIYGESVCGTRALTIMAYFRAGLQIADAAKQIMEWRFGSTSNVGSYLEFAAGYGRSARFIVKWIPPERVWISEILAGAVQFQPAEFGVHGIQSSTKPEDLNPQQRFDFIFVSSLFSHLPDKTFCRWLGRLHQLLTPGGVLVFSVHDEEVIPAFKVMPPEGIYFEPLTEIPSLDPQDYGATIVTEAYVARAIAQATGRSHYGRVRKVLGFHQDVYVVVNADSADYSGLAKFRHGAHGCLDQVHISGENELTARGWTADMSPGHVVREVQLIVNGKVRASVPPHVSRPDVASYLGNISNRGFLYSGWHAVGRVPEGLRPGSDVIMAKAVSDDGKSYVMHFGLLDPVAAPAPAPAAAPAVVTALHPPPERRLRVLAGQARDYVRQVGARQAAREVWDLMTGTPVATDEHR